MEKIILLKFSAIALMLIINGCGITAPIQQYNESKSNFSKPTILLNNNYPTTDIYQIYHRASTGFTSVQSLRKAAYKRIDEFAQQRGKKFIVLGEQISNAPYIMGNFQRIEIVFALIDKIEKPIDITPKKDKFSELEKLKQLLDNGTLTKEEYEKEKNKILDEKE